MASSNGIGCNFTEVSDLTTRKARDWWKPILGNINIYDDFLWNFIEYTETRRSNKANATAADAIYWWFVPVINAQTYFRRLEHRAKGYSPRKVDLEKLIKNAYNFLISDFFAKPTTPTCSPKPNISESDLISKIAPISDQFRTLQTYFRKSL